MKDVKNENPVNYRLCSSRRSVRNGYRILDMVCMMQTKTIAEIATYEPVNKVDAERSTSCALDIARKKTCDGWVPIFLYEHGRRAVTGSHRIIAARLIMLLFDVSTDGHQLSAIEVPIIDATKQIDEFCARTKTGFPFLPFGNLREIFSGGPLEKYARLNKEW